MDPFWLTNGAYTRFYRGYHNHFVVNMNISLTDHPMNENETLTKVFMTMKVGNDLKTETFFKWIKIARERTPLDRQRKERPNLEVSSHYPNDDIFMIPG